MTEAPATPPYPRIEALTAAVRDIAREVIMARYLTAVRARKTDGSLLTQVDLAAEAALAQRLPQIIDGPVLGEEMPAERQREIWETGDAGFWCIDPIDGTTNFINGIPFFAVSVAWMVGRRPQLALVYNPASGEAFAAERGCGAWLNGLRLPLRDMPGTLAECVAGVDFKRVPRPLADNLAARPPYHSQRSFGSSALEWCFVAAGRLDVYLHGGQMLWDYCAGQLILAEAGGAMCTLTHDDFAADDPWKRSVIAARTPALLPDWRDWLRAHD